MGDRDRDYRSRDDRRDRERSPVRGGNRGEGSADIGRRESRDSDTGGRSGGAYRGSGYRDRDYGGRSYDGRDDRRDDHYDRRRDDRDRRDYDRPRDCDRRREDGHSRAYTREYGRGGTGRGRSRSPDFRREYPNSSRGDDRYGVLPRRDDEKYGDRRRDKSPGSTNDLKKDDSSTPAPDINVEELDAETLQSMFGFAGFNTTKGQKVQSDIGAVNVKTELQVTADLGICSTTTKVSNNPLVRVCQNSSGSTAQTLIASVLLRR
ncbi:hypothetical protein SeMB42_g06591 [Synchytrium endobioticum]|uniref:U4/U6.U5 small nuclear ribonucleoprotein 27kDa protein domain-containing protein n=1 Tax=Synchytrium endobioticum TaxID=286115 RepID=A0A507CKB8_9FUNG|nr:hypothetical protein SeMB42_g06591 [Synchytrium endobioticum]TPX41178.1 hypothetical protein SeLEV6574_g06223 [Synchytrium endobioticum]